ncbi:MAG: hypothetical protein KAW09_09080 [Thermoplasmata archaeon]|nr:hypothetical protein [Thermoplasmata archaeon]
MRDIVKGIEELGLTLVAGILAIYAVLSLMFGSILFFLSDFAAGMMGTWIMLFGGLYLALAFGIPDRREWALYGTLVLVPIALLSYILSFTVSYVAGDGFLVVTNFIHIMVHIAIIAVVLLNYKEFTWKPSLRAPPRAELRDDRTKGHRCEICKSENLMIFPDGSGRYNECLHVFKNVWERGG